MSTSVRWHPFHWVVLGLSVSGLAFTAVFALALAGADRPLDLGWRAAPDPAAPDTMHVTRIGTAGTAERLREGDRILAIDGDSRVHPDYFWLHFQHARAGDAYRLLVERDGRELDLAMVAGLGERKLARARSAFLFRIPFLVTAFAVALLVGILRPDVRAARVFCVMGLVVSAASLWTTVPSHALEMPHEAVRRAMGIVAFFSNALVYHAFAVFPRAPRGRAISILAFYVVSGAFLVDATVGAWWGLQATPELIDWIVVSSPLRDAMSRASRIYWLVLMAAVIVIVAANYRAVDGPADRRRIRWVTAGALVGLLPTLAFAALRFLDQLQVLPAFANGWMVLIEDARYLFLAVIPASIGYAMTRQRLFDVRFVVRQGLQHLLARRSLQVLTLLPAGLLVASILAGTGGPLQELIAWRPAALGLLALTFVGQWKRGAWLTWLDRRFFRAAYDRQRILTDLVQATSTQGSLEGLLRHVRRQLDEAFAPLGIAVLARDLGGGGVFRDAEGGATVSRDDALVCAAESHEGPMELSSANALAAGIVVPAQALDELGDDTPSVLEASRSEVHPPAATGSVAVLPTRLLVPVRDRDGQVVVVIALGERRSEEPYSKEDRELCELLARQIAIAYENAQLKEHVESAARRRDEMISGLEREGAELLRECPRCGRCFDHGAARCDADDAELVHTLPTPRMLEGRYRLDRRIGRGGMGAVYEARDTRLDRTVAVKLLLGRSFGDARALRRFEGEARALARLGHPNVVGVHDYGVTELDGAFLVMELLEGETLSDVIARTGGVPGPLVADWMDQACRGVSAIHDQGIIHRDLKPSNVLLVASEEEANGRVKIVDFGLAKIATSNEERHDPLTASGTVIGTPAYMAPEQLSGERVDPRTDVYALAIIAVELLTGCHPSLVEGGTPRAVVGLSRDVTVEGEGGAALNELLARCLATRRARRPGSVEELRAELVPLLQQCGDVRLETDGGGQDDETEVGRRSGRR